jgi:hypothetical protein
VHDGGCNELGTKCSGAIAPAVVGQHPLDRDSVGQEEGSDPAPKTDRRGGVLAGMDLRVGKARVGVYGRVDVGIAKPRSARLSVLLASGDPVDLPTPATRDLGLLLDIDVNELAGPRGLDPTDHPPTSTLEV